MKLAGFATFLPLAFSEVVQLNSDNFAVTEAADLTLVKFFAPWCGHCQAMQEDWEAASDKVPENVMIAEVDCTQDQALCGKYDVGGYPTLMSFKNGKLHEEFYDRNLKSILNYVNKNGGSIEQEEIADTGFTGKTEEAPEVYQDGTVWKVVGSNFEEVVFDDDKLVFIKVESFGDIGSLFIALVLSGRRFFSFNFIFSSFGNFIVVIVLIIGTGVIFSSLNIEAVIRVQKDVHLDPHRISKLFWTQSVVFDLYNLCFVF